VDMPKTEGLRAGETPSEPPRADPQLDLALDIVTAASIMDYGSDMGGAHSGQAGPLVKQPEKFSSGSHDPLMFKWQDAAPIAEGLD
jgi:hypothetical protein